MKIGYVLTLGLAMLAVRILTASPPLPSDENLHGEFQFSAAFDNAGLDGELAHGFTAYLWIPPSAATVQAVIVTQQNVGEQPFTEDPAIRAVCARNGIAILWCVPAIDLRFENKREESVHLMEHVLRTLGDQSGYAEVGSAPWITFGHSTTTQFARSVAEARPARTLAIISAKGGVKLAATSAVPGLYSSGHYPEWRQPTHDWAKNGTVLGGLVRLREDMSQQWRPASFVEEFGGGHFDYTRRYRDFLALYIEKVMQYRLNNDGSLRPVAQEHGSIVDVRPPLPQAPLRILPWAEATAEQRNGPWYFDLELAGAAVALMDHGHWERKNQMVAWANLNGTPATFAKSGIVDPVPCEYAADGVTITRMETTFLLRLPDNFTQAGMPFSHATSGPRTIEPISGVFAVRDSGYQIELNRGWPQTPNFIAVRHAGDDLHRPSVQPGRFVPPVYTGRAQRIDFPAVGDQSVGAGAVQLRATSSAGLKVRYFVRSGPAKAMDDRLVFLPLPPRAKLPVPVNVVAWQIGTNAGEGVAPALPVEQILQVGAPANAR